MSLLDWAKKALGNNDIRLSEVLKINNDNNSSKVVIKAKNVNVINLGSANKEDRNTILKGVTEQFENMATPLIIQDSEETLELLDKLEPEESLLNYFQDKIPKNDLKILEASLYLKALQDNGETDKIMPLRQSLIREYGVRAQNISNLCTAGYYEGYIKPLYKEMSREEAFRPNFDKNYEIIVDEFPFAFFVNSNMSFNQVKDGILTKIKRDSKYGLGYIRIHGIGKGNVQKITRLIKDDDFSNVIKEDPIIESGEKYIIIQISFRPQAINE